jgi:hypothetical protein
MGMEWCNGFEGVLRTAHICFAAGSLAGGWKALACITAFLGE